MKITCNIIGDLLPLYAEKIANSDTKDLIEEHLLECESCKSRLDELTQVMQIPTKMEELPMATMQKKHSWGVINFILGLFTIATIIFAGLSFLATDFNFLPFDNISIDFETQYSHTTSNSQMVATDYDSIVEYIDGDGDAVVDETLAVNLTGYKFSNSNLTQVPVDGSDKYIYYLEVYGRITDAFGHGSSTHYLQSNSITSDSGKSISDHIAAVYVATPEQDYLVYGEDVATEKFEVTPPSFATELFVLICSIVALICLFVRLYNKNLSEQHKNIINFASIFLTILLANSWVVLLLNTSVPQIQSDFLGIYYILNAVAITLTIFGISCIIYTILKSNKEDKKYFYGLVLMCIGVCFTLFAEKSRLFENISYRINPQYYNLLWGVLALVLIGMFLLGLNVYKNDTTKPKQIISKQYIILQSVLFLNVQIYQMISLYIYDKKDMIIASLGSADQKQFYFLELFSIVDIVNLSACVIIVYAFYRLVAKKDYPMLMIILQAMASSLEKTNYFSLHLGSLDDMNYLTYQVFILSYVMLIVTLIFVKKVISNSK